MGYIMALDQGTTSSRAFIYDENFRTIAVSQKPLGICYPGNGWVEQNPEEIWDSIVTVGREVISKAGIDSSQIDAIGITNQRETSLLWNKHTGEPIYNAIVWQDRRTAGQCLKLKEDGFEGVIKNKTGLLLDPYFSSTKISWILDNVNGARKKAENGELRFGTVDTYLLWQLSNGKIFKTDVTNASRTNLYNINTKSWDEELLEIFKVPSSMLPEVHHSDANFGTVSRHNKEITITGIIGDQQSALVGQRCFQPGQMKATFGTGCFLMVNTGKQLKKSSSGLLNTIGYGISGDTPYAVEGSIFSAGTIIQWLRDNMKFFSDLSLIHI